TPMIVAKGPPFVRGKRARASVRYFAPGVNVQCDGIFFTAFNNYTTGQSATGKDSWTTVTLEAIDSISYSGSNANLQVWAAKAGNTSVVGNGTDVFYIRDVVAHETGAICDLNFNVGAGTVVPDR